MYHAYSDITITNMIIEKKTTISPYVYNVYNMKKTKMYIVERYFYKGKEMNISSPKSHRPLLYM